jgi:hypothetical protein
LVEAACYTAGADALFKSRTMKVRLLNLIILFAGICPISASPAVTADKPYLLRYDKPAPLDLKGWEFESLPLGNGYFGVSVFGKTIRYCRQDYYAVSATLLP